MIDFRPVGHVIGLLVTALGASMIVPMFIDILSSNEHWTVFFNAAAVSMLTGGVLTLATANSNTQALSLQQTFLLTTLVWVMLPVFGAIPFLFSPIESTVTDAFFEAVSGVTTTGSTVYSGLDDFPQGLLLWRSMLQWFGGIGIIVVAMVFLPELRVGGMQVFRTEAFDTMGKILPRAAEIAAQISYIYVLLTMACFLGYLTLGMTSFEAINHALTTIATGGFSTTDASFSAFRGPTEYFAAAFMILASLPFVRYIQLVAGTAKPILRDAQIRAYLGIITVAVVSLAAFQMAEDGTSAEPAFRASLFNVTSIISGTGFASVNYQAWGAFAMVVFFFIGLIGGCAGSTCCSVKVFRYQILVSAIWAQVRRIHSPHGVFAPRFEDRRVSEEVLSSVMAFFVLFVVSLGLLAVALGLTGVDFVTATSGAATAIGNIGPGLGPIIGPDGNFGPLNDAAKWLCIIGMLVGRLELMAVYVLFTVQFWRG